jgi:hypothetical protein
MSAASASAAYARLRVAVRELKRESLLRRLGGYTASEWRRTGGKIVADTVLHPWNASLLAREALLSSRSCERTRSYVIRRTAEGKSSREIRRAIKRYVTRELYRALTAAMTT